jgi:acetyltransferase-like isoleucine patch superfamily enzyme
MNDNELRDLAKKLTPFIAFELTNTPVMYGNYGKVECESNVKLSNTFFNLNSGSVSIGEFTFFGNNVTVITGSHDISKTNKERWAFPREGNNIVIGKGVWIASNAIILGPCIIGDNAVIASGSVVLSGTYESNTLYAGVPAKYKRTII